MSYGPLDKAVLSKLLHPLAPLAELEVVADFSPQHAKISMSALAKGFETWKKSTFALPKSMSLTWRGRMAASAVDSSDLADANSVALNRIHAENMAVILQSVTRGKSGKSSLDASPQ